MQLVSPRVMSQRRLSKVKRGYQWKLAVRLHSVVFLSLFLLGVAVPQRVGIASGALSSTTHRCAQDGLPGATRDHLPVCTPLFEIQGMGVRESVGVRVRSRMMVG